MQQLVMPIKNQNTYNTSDFASSQDSKLTRTFESSLLSEPKQTIDFKKINVTKQNCISLV